MNRRKALKRIGQSVVMFGGMLASSGALFAAWVEAAFSSKDADSAIKELFGDTAHEASEKITLNAPAIAENGATVPMSVDTELDAQQIAIIIENNPTPLAFNASLPEGTLGSIATRVRMGKTSNVIAIVKSGDKLYSASAEVKVTIGGCGG